jgi:hypothetical protein|nr:hypothetical protein [Kofleriaceae bacterium]
MELVYVGVAFGVPSLAIVVGVLLALRKLARTRAWWLGGAAAIALGVAAALAMPAADPPPAPGEPNRPTDAEFWRWVLTPTIYSGLASGALGLAVGGALYARRDARHRA